MQAAHGEAVVAQQLHRLARQSASAEAGTQGEAEVGEPVVGVDAPQQGLTGQLAGGQLDHGEAGRVLPGRCHGVRGLGGAGGDRPPRPGVGPGTGGYIVVELALEYRDVAVVAGAKADSVVL